MFFPYFWREIFSFISQMYFTYFRFFLYRFLETNNFLRCSTSSNNVSAAHSSSRKAHLLSFREPFRSFATQRRRRVLSRKIRSYRSHSSTLLYSPLYFHYPTAVLLQERDRAWNRRLKPVAVAVAVAARRAPIPIASTHRRQRRRVSRIMCAYGHDYMTRQITVVPDRYNIPVHYRRCAIGHTRKCRYAAE